MNILQFGSQRLNPQPFPPKPVVCLIDGADTRTVPPTLSQHALVMKGLLNAFCKDDIQPLQLMPIADTYFKSVKEIHHALTQVRQSIEAGDKVDYVMAPNGFFCPLSALALLVKPGVKLTQNNLQQHQGAIIQALNKVAQNKAAYPQFLTALKQYGNETGAHEFEHLPGILSEINRLNDLGCKFYTVAGNRNFNTLKHHNNQTLRPNIYRKAGQG